ncbi:hypothetical protein STENM36S_04548 [Streptomyces tendae]
MYGPGMAEIYQLLHEARGKDYRAEARARRRGAGAGAQHAGGLAAGRRLRHRRAPASLRRPLRQGRGTGAVRGHAGDGPHRGAGRRPARRGHARPRPEPLLRRDHLHVRLDRLSEGRRGTDVDAALVRGPPGTGRCRSGRSLVVPGDIARPPCERGHGDGGAAHDDPRLLHGARGQHLAHGRALRGRRTGRRGAALRGAARADPLHAGRVRGGLRRAGLRVTYVGEIQSGRGLFLADRLRPGAAERTGRAGTAGAVAVRRGHGGGGGARDAATAPRSAAVSRAVARKERAGRRRWGPSGP